MHDWRLNWSDCERRCCARGLHGTTARAWSVARPQLQRWLTDLRETELMPRLGRVSQFFGLVVEAVGPDAFVGEMCQIHAKDRGTPVNAEVLGLKDGKVLLMPYDELKGVSLG